MDIIRLSKEIRGHSKPRRSIALSVVVLFALLLTACSGSGSGSATPTPRATSPSSGGGGATPTASVTPAILLGPQSCPNAVKDPAHWDQVIPTQPGVSKVEGVTCGYLTGTPNLQALITVRYNSTGGLLDVYVYSAIESPNPTQLFKLLGLYKGDARISLRNTVMTAEVDQNSSVNKGKSAANFTQDLFREFNTASFAPVSFPGMFPDMTRFQAELDQRQANTGQDSWKLSAMQVAAHFAIDPALLNWTNVNGTMVSGGGSNDAEAVVNISSAAPGTQTVTLTMQRLEGNTNGGIWEVVGVAAPAATGLSITAPQSRDLLTNPVTVSGTGPAFGGTIGTVTILDHTYSDIGQVAAKGANGSGNTTFSVTVPYVSTFKTGMQDAILALFAANNAGSTVATAVMVKELI